MKKFLLLIVAVFSCVVTKAQITESYKVEIGQFDKIKVTDNVNVVYRNLPDSTGFAQYTATKEFADAFILTPKEGMLRIQVSTEDLGSPELPTLYVYSDFLTSVENSSNFTLKVENPAPCAEFSAKQIGNGTIVVENIKANVVRAALATGNGTVNLSGSCRDAVFRMVGTGIISADRLETENVQCRILGGGSIGCWPTEKLTVKGIGSTKIYYKGNPDIKKSGGGKLFTLPSDRPMDTIINTDESDSESDEDSVVEDTEEESDSTDNIL